MTPVLAPSPSRRALLWGVAAALAAGPAQGRQGGATHAYGPHPRQRLDLFPAAGDGPGPVLMFLPGGGWRTHARTDAWSLPAFARREGLLLAVADYRAMPEAGARAQAQDAAAAFAWLRAHAREHGGDPTRIFVMGHSAGGHLAALISADPSYLAAHGLAPADIAGVLLLDGAAYDAREQTRFLHAFPRTRAYFDALFEGDYAAFTPADRLSAEVPGPPMLLIYAADRPYPQRQNTALAAALRRVGRPNRVIADRGASHLSIAADFGRHGDRVSARAARFIRTGRL